MRTIFLFRFWPYMAAAVFLAGIAWRLAKTRRVAASAWKLAEAELMEAQSAFGGGRLWRIGLLLLGAGHLGGLLFPREILLWNVAPLRLYALEGVAFAAGLAAFAGWAGLMWRHLSGSTPEESRLPGAVQGMTRAARASQLADVMFLSLLCAAGLSGLLTAGFYRWGSSWGVLTLTPYVRSLLAGHPAPGLAAEMPFLVRLHVFSALAALAMVPFTRMAPLVTVPLHRGLAWLLAPAAPLARWLRRGLESAFLKLTPGARIWPEEE